MIKDSSICVLIPAYKVKAQIQGVLATIPDYVDAICLVDDCCPEGSGAFARTVCHDPRLHIIHHEVNQGVGGALVTGYRYVLEQGFDIAVKVDGDGQMDPAFIATLVRPITLGQADYTKGTRFYSPGMFAQMPKLRLFGNVALSFVSKFTSGYWSVMDPTNGYTAIHRKLLGLISLSRLETRYFFESDMLYHLGVTRAVVADVPMIAKYADEVSNLHIGQVLMDFPKRYLVRFFKRFVFNYLLRDFNVGSFAALVGLPLLLWGLGFGAFHWWHSGAQGITTPTGTIMFAVLPLIVGIQLLIAAMLYDVANQPKQVLHTALP